MNRRDFCLGSALALTVFEHAAADSRLDVAAIDHARVLKAADRYLDEAPTTITAFAAPRSPGGRHDYYSEADYWWPDPADPCTSIVGEEHGALVVQSLSGATVRLDALTGRLLGVERPVAAAG